MTAVRDLLHRFLPAWWFPYYTHSELLAALRRLLPPKVNG